MRQLRQQYYDVYVTLSQSSTSRSLRTWLLSDWVSKTEPSSSAHATWQHRPIWHVQLWLSTFHLSNKRQMTSRPVFNKSLMQTKVVMWLMYDSCKLRWSCSAQAAARGIKKFSLGVARPLTLARALSRHRTKTACQVSVTVSLQLDGCCHYSAGRGLHLPSHRQVASAELELEGGCCYYTCGRGLRLPSHVISSDFPLYFPLGIT